MSKKDINQLNIYSKINDKKIHKLDALFEKKEGILQSYIGKRKRTSINKGLYCYYCKKKNNFDIYSFKNKKDLFDTIKGKINNNKELKNNIKLIKQISGRFKKSTIICNKCFEEVVMNEDCINKIKLLFFVDKDKRTAKKSSLHINYSNTEIDLNKNSVNEIILPIKKRQNRIDVNYIKEYEECFQNIVQYLKITVLEVSFFAKTFKNYINNNNIISQNYLNINNFFDSYFHTKLLLENLFSLINKILIKYKEITIKIISSFNLANPYNSDENFKNNYEKFIYNTNLILANLLNLVNNYKIFLNVLRCSNDNEAIKK